MHLVALSMSADPCSSLSQSALIPLERIVAVVSTGNKKPLPKEGLIPETGCLAHLGLEL